MSRLKSTFSAKVIKKNVLVSSQTACSYSRKLRPPHEFGALDGTNARLRVHVAPRGPGGGAEDPRVETGPVQPLKLFRSLLCGQNIKALAQLANEAQWSVVLPQKHPHCVDFSALKKQTQDVMEVNYRLLSFGSEIKSDAVKTYCLD